MCFGEPNDAIWDEIYTETVVLGPQVLYQHCSSLKHDDSGEKWSLETLTGLLTAVRPPASISECSSSNFTAAVL